MNTFTSLYVDLKCNKQDNQSPRYRIFIDDVLVVERSYWPDVPMHYIQERFSFLDDNNKHYFKLENIGVVDAVYIDKINMFNTDNPEEKYNYYTWNTGSNCFNFLTPKR